MQYRGIPNWPPVWTQKGQTRLSDVPGKVATLQRVYSDGASPCQCHLLIEHSGDRFMEALIFNDSAFCAEVTGFLRNQIGKSIEEIGNTDFSQ